MPCVVSKALFETVGMERYGGSLPKPRDEHVGGDVLADESKRLRSITDWLNALLAGETLSDLLEVDAIDHFLELFWNTESARKAGPVKPRLQQIPPN